MDAAAEAAEGKRQAAAGASVIQNSECRMQKVKFEAERTGQHEQQVGAAQPESGRVDVQQPRHHPRVDHVVGEAVVDGELVGGLGASGATAAEDEECVLAAARSLGFD